MVQKIKNYIEKKYEESISLVNWKKRKEKRQVDTKMIKLILEYFDFGGIVTLAGPWVSGHIVQLLPLLKKIHIL